MSIGGECRTLSLNKTKQISLLSFNKLRLLKDFVLFFFKAIWCKSKQLTNSIIDQNGEVMKIKHPAPLEVFQNERPELFAFALKVHACKKHVIIKAPVKSGKKEMAFIQAMLSSLGKKENQQTLHVYLTGLARNDIKVQLWQYRSYGIHAETIYHSQSAEIITTLAALFAKNKKVIVHLDESDYASGKDQKLSKLFDFLNQQDLEKLLLRLYSATQEEVIFSDFADNAEIMTFIPPPNYFGAVWALTKHKESKPFLSQIDEIITDFISKKDRPIGIVRITGSDKKKGNSRYFSLQNDQELEKKLRKDNIELYFINDTDRFYWEDEEDSSGNILHNSWDRFVDRFNQFGQRTIIVVNQKATRSTEIQCHKYLAFIHDHREMMTTQATYHQAIGRVFHYQEIGESENDIAVWCQKDVLDFIASNSSQVSRRKVSSRLHGYSSVKYGTYIIAPSITVKKMTYAAKGSETEMRRHISKNNRHNVAKHILNGIRYGDLIHIDSANLHDQNHVDSFNELISKHPELKGHWVKWVPLDSKSRLKTKETSMYQNKKEIEAKLGLNNIENSQKD